MGEKKVYQSELSFGNRIARLVWGIVSFFLFQSSPRIAHGWRRVLLRCFGAKLGPSVKIYPSARIWAPWNLIVGAGAIIGDRVDLYSVACIEIGTRAIVSQDSSLCAATHDFRSETFELIPKPIVVGPRAWVAARAFVGPGVVIGAGAVVGACAVVFRNVEEGAVVVGNPSKVVSWRN